MTVHHQLGVSIGVQGNPDVVFTGRRAGELIGTLENSTDILAVDVDMGMAFLRLRLWSGPLAGLFRRSQVACRQPRQQEAAGRRVIMQRRLAANLLACEARH